MNFDILFSKYCELIENKRQKMLFKDKLVLFTFIFLMFAIAVLFSLYIFTPNWMYLLSFAVSFALFLTLLVFLSFKNKAKTGKFENEQEKSEKYFNEVIELLKQHNVNINNTATIDLLIEEAKEKQKSNFSVGFNKAVTMLSSLYYLIVTLVCKALYDKYGFWKLIIFLSFAVFFFFIISVVFQFVKSFLKLHFEFKHMNHNKFIYDLKQIKIFYAKN